MFWKVRDESRSSRDARVTFRFRLSQGRDGNRREDVDRTFDTVAERCWLTKRWVAIVDSSAAFRSRFPHL